MLSVGRRNLAHEVHASGEATLVAPLKYEEHYEECGEKGNYIWCHVVMVRCCDGEVLRYDVEVLFC